MLLYTVAHIYTGLKYRNDGYKDFTREALDMLTNFSPRAEIYKDREFFLDLTGAKNVHKILADLTELLTPAYCDTMVISVACTKLTSRACSLAVVNMPKKYIGTLPVKLKVVNKNVILATVGPDEKNFWSLLPVHLLWPLDNRLIRQLQFLGLNSCKQVQEISLAELARHFGSQAHFIYRYCRGIDYERVRSVTGSDRQLMRHYPLRGCADRLQWDLLFRQAADSLAAELSARLEGFRELKLTVQDENHRIKTAAKKFNRVLFTSSAIQTNLHLLINRLSLSGPLCSIMICLQGITPVPTQQTELFAEKALAKPQAKPAREKLAEVIENLNRKYPSQPVSLGGFLTISRREKMLQLWDPYRFTKEKVKMLGETYR